MDPETEARRLVHANDLDGLRRFIYDGDDLLRTCRYIKYQAANDASMLGQYEMVRWLMERCHLRGYSRSLLHDTVATGNVGMVLMLVREGYADVDQLDDNGKTALQVALENKKFQVAKDLVLWCGADPTPHMPELEDESELCQWMNEQLPHVKSRRQKFKEEVRLARQNDFRKRQRLQYIMYDLRTYVGTTESINKCFEQCRNIYCSTRAAHLIVAQACLWRHYDHHDAKCLNAYTHFAARMAGVSLEKDITAMSSEEAGEIARKIADWNTDAGRALMMMLEC